MKFMPMLLLAFAVMFFLSACGVMPQPPESAVSPPAAQEERGVWTIGEKRIVQAVYCKSQADAEEIAWEYVLKGPDAANAILTSKMTGDLVTAGFCNMRVVKFVVKRLVSTWANGKEVMNVIEVEDAGGDDGPNGAIYYVVNWSHVVQAASGTPGVAGSRT